jgi:4'-phosphopantetheinyl transferase
MVAQVLRTVEERSVVAVRDEAWDFPPPAVAMPDSIVHVWRATLDPPVRHVERLTGLLSEAEHVRAGQFCLERDRRRFVVRRGLLRLILGWYLTIPADRLRLSSGVAGKPGLAPSQARGIDFSLSHSHGIALYAVTCDRRIGVDIERVRTVPGSHGLAEQVLSPREYAVFRALPRERQQAALFCAWTRKEAYAKACGQGLSCPFDRIDVSLPPFEPPRPLSIHGDPREASGWSLQDVTPVPGYAAAVASEGHDALPVRSLQWPEWL